METQLEEGDATTPEQQEDSRLASLLENTISEANSRLDTDAIIEAFRFASDAHKGQKRKSGEGFIIHPVEVARIVVEMQLDQDSVIAALLHDVVEDTDYSIEDMKEHFGEKVALIVEGVTNLSKINFASREQAQIENYRKMIVAMAADYRVILVKLADRLHNMRTIRYLPKQKQLVKAKETIEIFAPIAHRLGIHTIKWELEDLSFAVLYPRKYSEIQKLVQQRKADRDRVLNEVKEQLQSELERVGINADIKGRTKHFYSIYQKMQRKGKEFNEIHDLTGIRVLVDRVADCYAAIGTIHSLWTPLEGRFKDYIAIPKSNGYQSLHTTVVGKKDSPLQGKAIEIQVRTYEMNRMAEYGIAAHFRYKDKPGASSAGKKRTDISANQPTEGKSAKEWIMDLAQWESAAGDGGDFMEGLRFDLYDDEVYVFTPAGDVKNLQAGATPLDFAYSVHTDVGHRCVGAKVNGRIVPLSYRLKSGDQVEVLTSNQLDKGPSRDWTKIVTTSRAKSKIRHWFAREKREDLDQRGREQLIDALKQQKIPHAKISGSSMLASIIREMGFKKADDFYVALGAGKFTPTVVVNKILQQLKTDQAVPDDQELVGIPIAKPRTGKRSSEDFGVRVDGIADSSTVVVRLAKCCMPVPGDPIKGYISLGKGITIHRGDCPNVKALMKNPERFTPVHWDGHAHAAFRVEIQVDAWDRARLLEDISRTISEHGANIVAHSGIVEDDMVRERFTMEIGDINTLRSVLASLRNIDSIFDVYRVTPN